MKAEAAAVTTVSRWTAWPPSARAVARLPRALCQHRQPTLLLLALVVVVALVMASAAVGGGVPRCSLPCSAACLSSTLCAGRVLTRGLCRGWATRNRTCHTTCTRAVVRCGSSRTRSSAPGLTDATTTPAAATPQHQHRRPCRYPHPPRRWRWRQSEQTDHVLVVVVVVHVDDFIRCVLARRAGTSSRACVCARERERERECVCVCVFVCVFCFVSCIDCLALSVLLFDRLITLVGSCVLWNSPTTVLFHFICFGPLCLFG